MFSEHKFRCFFGFRDVKFLYKFWTTISFCGCFTAECFCSTAKCGRGFLVSHIQDVAWNLGNYSF